MNGEFYIHTYSRVCGSCNMTVHPCCRDPFDFLYLLHNQTSTVVIALPYSCFFLNSNFSPESSADQSQTCFKATQPNLVICLLCPHASNGLRSSAGLKMPIHIHFFWQAILTRKVGHTDLVFGVQSGFLSRSVHSRLKVSVSCHSCHYDL